MASCNANALITVASMPMVSEVVRSRPWPSPIVPRQMLPPPTTMASSMSSSARARVISRAKRSTTLASMVSSDADEASASPDILRTSRRRRSASGAAEMSATAVDLGSTPALSVADNDLREAHDLRALYDFGDRAFFVPGVRLVEEHPLLEPAVHATLHDLGQRRFRLALVARDPLDSGALGLHLFVGDVLAAKVRGTGERHVHRHVVGELVGTPPHLHEHRVHPAA